MGRIQPHLLVALCGAGCIPELPEFADPCAEWAETGLFRLKLDVDGRKAPYVWVPPGAGPRDVVVVLHGGGQSARSFSEATQHLRLAEQRGFVAVFPSGRGWPVRGWNVDEVQSSWSSDDVAYLDALVDEVRSRTCGDRVLGTGFSQGGMMAHRWACAGGQVDAIVPAAGPLLSDPDVCAGEPMPVRHYHGRVDPSVPVQGGAGALGWVFPSAEETMAAWRERNLCEGEGVDVVGERTTCTSWSCAAPTELCLIDDWGHAWPGGARGEGLDVDATVDGYEFFVDSAG